jgi:iron(III) transport system substrate-binding protein
MRRRRQFALAFLYIGILLLIAISIQNRRYDKLVVYCAHDIEYAREVLERFHKKTGIEVSVQPDAEHTKSLGLVERIVREKEARACDLFWNNELFGTMRLAREGFLEPYQGPGWQRIPAEYKDPSGLWAAMGARFRVWILPEASEEASALVTATLPASAKCAVAKPLYGTTLTHYTVLWSALGKEELATLHESSRKQGLREVNGNAATRDLVAEGGCLAAWTDSDDYFVARDAGKPVRMMPVRDPRGRTIAIPNSVGIIKGTARLKEAQQLADFLLSEEAELMLARGRARQVPVGSTQDAELPEAVRAMQPWLKEAVPLTTLYGEYQACLEWLKQVYAKK